MLVLPPKFPGEQETSCVEHCFANSTLGADFQWIWCQAQSQWSSTIGLLWLSTALLLWLKGIILTSFSALAFCGVAPCDPLIPAAPWAPRCTSAASWRHRLVAWPVRRTAESLAALVAVNSLLRVATSFRHFLWNREVFLCSLNYSLCLWNLLVT